jgi:hypothetical protein
MHGLEYFKILQHFWILPTGTSYSMNYVPESVKVSVFTQITELQNSHKLGC